MRISNVTLFKTGLSSQSKIFPKFLSRQRQQRLYATASATSSPAQKNNKDEHLWVKSPYGDIEPVVGKTLTEFLWERVLQWGNAPAFECGVTGRKYNYAELYRYSRGFAAGLMKAGLRRNEVIGIVLPNLPEFPIALMGSWDAGCVPSTVNPAYTSHEIMRQLQNSESKFVLTIDLFLPAVLEAKKSCPNLTTVIIIGDSAKIPEGCLSFHELMKTDPSGMDFVRGSEIDTVNTTALLPYSSGTTGPPKGVVLTHSSMTTNIAQFAHPDVRSSKNLDESGSQERYIGLLPFFHLYGGYLNLITMYQGASILCLPKFDPNLYIKAIRVQKPTVMHMVPPLISFLCQTPDCGKTEMEPTHTIMGAAAPIGPVLINKMVEKAGKYIFFQEGYGMTELSPLSHMLSPKVKLSKIGSCGPPIPSTTCKIVDTEGSGKVLGEGQKGEICVKGPQVMKGYLNNPKATAETIDEDGWLHTGDIGYYDKDSHFYIVDRLKELIKVKGLQVAPSELEDVLREHENVGDVAVIGVPDGRSGELPRAYIVRKGESLTVDEVNHYLKDKIADYKQLRGGVEFVDAIPKAPSGKILRRVILAEYKEKNVAGDVK